MKYKIKRAFAITLWVGALMISGSIAFTLISGQGFNEVVLGNSKLYYELLIILATTFGLGFLFAE